MQSEAEMDYIWYQARALKKVTPIYVAIRFVTKDLLYFFFRFVGSPSVVENHRARVSWDIIFDSPGKIGRCFSNKLISAPSSSGLSLDVQAKRAHMPSHNYQLFMAYQRTDKLGCCCLVEFFRLLTLLMRMMHLLVEKNSQDFPLCCKDTWSLGTVKRGEIVIFLTKFLEISKVNKMF